MALAVLVRRVGELPGDGQVLPRPASGWMQALALPVDAVTGYGGTSVMAALVVVLLLRLGRRGDAVRCAVSVTGALLGTALLKRVVARPRPESPALVEVSQFSFPSGHAAATAALALTVVLAVPGARGRALAAVGGALVVLGAAAAQLVLGLHRPSDVVGGWLWASAWTTAAWAAAGRRTT